MYFFGVTQGFQHGRLSSIESLETNVWWQILMMIALKHGVVFGLEPPMHFHELDSSRALVGAIELNREEVILASQALQRSVGVDDAL